MIDLTHGLTIQEGETLSDEIDLGNRKLVGIYLPATLDGPVVSVLTRTGDPSSGTYPVAYPDGSLCEIAATPGRYTLLPLEGVRFLRLGTSAQQTTDTKFTLALV